MYHTTHRWQCIIQSLHTGGNVSYNHYTQVVMYHTIITHRWQCIIQSLHTGGNASCNHYTQVAMHHTIITHRWQCIIQSLHKGGNASYNHYTQVAMHPQPLVQSDASQWWLNVPYFFFSSSFLFLLNSNLSFTWSRVDRSIFMDMPRFLWSEQRHAKSSTLFSN